MIVTWVIVHSFLWVFSLNCCCNPINQLFPNWWVETHQGNRKRVIPFKGNDPEIILNMISIIMLLLGREGFFVCLFV